MANKASAEQPASGEKAASRRTPGLGTFALLCVGQVVSLFGTRLSGFAIGVWVFESTGSATSYALIAVATMLPNMLASPWAGPLVDRWNRRWTMILGDSGAGVATLLLAFLVATQRLEVWHIYLTTAMAALFQTFQEPSFSATVPLLIPKRHLGRANGVIESSRAAVFIIGPPAAGVGLQAVGLLGLLAFDVATFLFAVALLLFIRLPRPAPLAEAETAREKTSLWRETLDGWRYIRERPGLMALLGLSFGLNFSFGIVNALLTPLVLTFASPTALGVVLSSASLGMLCGALLMSFWGGPARRVRGILTFVALQGAVLMAGTWRPSVALIAGGAFAFLALNPLILSCSQSLWQSKVAAGVQGRVHALRLAAASLSLGSAFLTAGLLADHVFEPWLAAGGALAPTLGRFIGVGPGRGIASIFVLMGFLMILTVTFARGYRSLVRLEEDLPDAI